MKLLLALLVSTTCCAAEQPGPMEPDEPTPETTEEGETTVCNKNVEITYLEGAIPGPPDEFTIARAKVRCGELYPDSPCVKKIDKRPGLRYRVTCGGYDA